MRRAADRDGGADREGERVSPAPGLAPARPHSEPPARPARALRALVGDLDGRPPRHPAARGRGDRRRHHPDDGEVILRYTVLILLVGLLQVFGFGLRRYAAFRLGYRVETDLRHRLFAHLQRLHFAFHDEAQTGQLMAHANTDIQQIKQTASSLIPLTIASSLMLVGVAVVIMLVEPRRSRCSRSARCRSSTSRATRFSHADVPGQTSRCSRSSRELSGVVEESVAGMRVVKGFGAERAADAARSSAEADSVLDQALAPARAARRLHAAHRLPARRLRWSAILWYGGHQVLDGNLAGRRHRRVQPLHPDADLAAADDRHADRAVVARVGVGRSRRTRCSPPTRDRRRRHAVTRCPTGGARSASKASRSAYGDGRAGARRPRPHDPRRRGGRARRRDRVAARPPSRRLHPALLRRRRRPGAASTASTCATSSCDELRRAVGIVFEDTFLFSDTVRENIAFADPEASMEQVVRAARLAGADEFVDALPDGYDTVIGEHGYSLSGGQRQRIAIARAVLADPRILILDDATSSVDPTKEHEIRAALARGDGRAGRRSSSPTARRRSRSPTASCCSTDGRVGRRRHARRAARPSPSYREVLARAEAETRPTARRRDDCRCG